MNSLVCFQDLQQLIRSILDAAAGQGAKSIAIPPIGTGNLGYPANIVARTMVMATSEYLSSNPQTALTDIRLVVLSSEAHLLDVSVEITLKRIATRNRLSFLFPYSNGALS